MEKKDLEELSLHDLSELYQKDIEFLDFLSKAHKTQEAKQ